LLLTLEGSNGFKASESGTLVIVAGARLTEASWFKSKHNAPLGSLGANIPSQAGTTDRIIRGQVGATLGMTLRDAEASCHGGSRRLLLFICGSSTQHKRPA
jgi:hypothetical protein